MPKKKINIEEFLEIYTRLITFPTYTSEKRAIKAELLKLLEQSKGDMFYFSRDSPSCKIHSPECFTIFQVRENQRGNLKVFRGKWVLMYCFHRNGYYHWSYVNELKKGADSHAFVERLAEEFPDRFIIAEP